MNKRFPLHVHIIGLMQLKKGKTYLSSVLWSDQNDVIVYRTFEEFKKLHRTIVMKFPLEAGRIKKSDRILPRFEDISGKERIQTRISKSVLRIRMLEKYCNHLLRCGAKISEDQEVVQFFFPTNKDLAPSFPSDSIIIMPSEVERKGNTWRRPGRTFGQDITQPVASENYKCITAYETKDTKKRPFKVLEDEIVDVITKNPSDDQYYAVKSYEAKDDDELSMHVGVIVEVLKKFSDGWWIIRYDGQSGYVPSLYLQPYRNPHSKLHILTKADRYRSTPNLLETVENSPIQSNNLQPKGHRYEVNNNLSTSDIMDVNNSLDKQKSKSTNCLPDQTIDKDDLSLPNPDELESRPESLSEEGVGMSTVSSGKSHLSENSSLTESYNLRRGSADISRLFEKNQTEASPGKSKSLDSGEEKVDLKYSPEASAGGGSSVTNLIPKIPPRPQRQEILSRCTTVTKNTVLRSQID
uniref:NADPH oxidase organizer 1-like isoform X2 n=1 Tax=Pristiophorus japonicus TaxID=55135 RepID=UPI00398F37E5